MLHFFHSTHSVIVTIATEDAYKDFVDNKFQSGPNVIVIIKEKAHPNILSLPAQYADAYYNTMFFDDGDNGAVQMWPMFRAVEAHYNRRTDPLVHLPITYEYYYFSLAAMDRSLHLIEYVSKWSNAKTIVARDTDGRFGKDLFNRRFELDNLRSLERLDFNIDQTSHRLPLDEIVKQIPTLHTITVDVSVLDEERLQYFINEQPIQPSTINKNYLTYAKE